MSDELTLDELATLGEDEAVARQFDAGNARIGRLFSAVVGFISFGLFLAAAGERGAFAAMPALTVLLSAAIFLGLRRVTLKVPPHAGRTRFLQPIARLYQRSPRSLTLSWLLLGISLVIASAYGTESLLPLTIMLGFFVPAFRLRAIERIALHLSVIGLCLGVAILGLGQAPAGRESGELLPALITSQGFAMVIGLLTTRRVRRSLVDRLRQGREQARVQVRMRQELDYAREIQLSMLPADCPTQDWLEICSLSWPATEVGGDYYDYFPLPGDRLAVVVGDVAGHGMASGLLLAGVRSSLTILVEDLDRPLEVLAKLNRMVQQTARRRMLVTLAIVVFDPHRRVATVASAGHPPVLVARAGRVEEVSLPSVPLGTQLRPEFGEREVPLETGDTLLLLSDGLYEGTNASGEPYGFARLAASLARQEPSAGAVEMRDAVLRDFTAFRGSAPQADDLTFLVVKVREGPERTG